MKIDYILPIVAGRLGNNLFMVANAYAKAKEYGKELYLYKSHFSNEYVNTIFKDFIFIDDYVDNKNYNLEIPSDNTHTLYTGYFQSENYFNKYSNEIKDLFYPPIEFINKIKLELPIIFVKEITAIHVRRGDYLSYPDIHPTLSKEYILEAIKHVPNNQILIVSDDIEWCKKNLNIEGAIYSEGYKSYEDLWILSLCHHFVISNSSFSWWGAYLSKNKNKIVIAPKTWYGPNGPKNWDEIYCKNWIIHETLYKNGYIYSKD
jgi:hypothetical protein